MTNSDEVRVASSRRRVTFDLDKTLIFYISSDDQALEIRATALRMNLIRNIYENFIPGGVRRIGYKGFESVEILTLPRELEEIAAGDFLCCKNLKHVIIPNGVRKIGMSAFEGCEGIESVIFPDGLEELGCTVFYGCKNLKVVILPNGVRKIGWAAFFNCLSIENITLPESLEEIAEFSFENCNQLKRIFIKTKDREKCVRIIRLLPESLKSKVLSEEVSERILEIEEGVLSVKSELNFFYVKMHTKVRLPMELQGEIASYISKEIGYRRIYLTSFYPELRRAFESVSLPESERELADYQKSLVCIRDRILCVSKLKDYVKVAKKKIPPSYFKGEGFFNHKKTRKQSDILDRLKTLDNLINRFEEGAPLEVSEEEFTRLNTETLRAIFKKYNVRLPEMDVETSSPCLLK